MKKRVSERRERLRRIAEADAKNRCALCRRAIVGQAVSLFGEPERYCSQACADEAIERSAMRQSR